MNESPRKAARNKLIFALGLLAVCVAGYLVTSRYANPRQGTENMASSTVATTTESTTTATVQGMPAPTDPEAGWTEKSGVGATEGTIVCLPHRNTDGAQTMECALGLKATNGLYYALQTKRAEDYKVLTESPNDTRIRVSGNITPYEALSDSNWMTYDIAGLIVVTTITRI